MKISTRLLLLLLVPAIIAGCGSSPGPDSISSHKPHSPSAFPDCVVCHSSAIFTRRQIFGAGGDFGANTDLVSHHVAGISDPTSDQCLVCHDLSSHMFGTIRLKHGDTGASIAYDPANPSSLESFCLSCHDADGANGNFSPFSDGGVLGVVPNAAGVKIKESWEKQRGHRRKGLTCLGDGTPGTGCHGNYNSATGAGTINAHGSDNVGLLVNKLTMPIWSNVWDESRYKLCLDCHNNYPSVLTISQLAGVAAGGNYAQLRTVYDQWPYTVDFMVTGFHDYYSYAMDRQYNLHLYHLLDGMGQWNYRGMDESIPTCVTCHNVHGVDGQYYYLWDEWNFSIVNSSGTEYGKVANGNFIGTQYPDFCANNCHWDGNYRYPRSPFNEAKAVASDTSGNPGVANGDTVTIYFSDSTNGPTLDETNINAVLALSGSHSWIDSNKGGNSGQLTAVWSSANGKTNNVLTITIFVNPGLGDPTISVGDSITFDLTTIKDTTSPGNPIRGKMTLRGNF